MAELGYAQEYEALICDAATGATLLALPWSSITWQRVKNEVSTASVNVSSSDGGIECCGTIGGLFPWTQMLRIERNGESVWDGPIVRWNQPSGTRNLTIGASDRSVLFQKRIVHTYRAYGASNPTDTPLNPRAIILQMAADALIGNSAYDPFAVNFSTATLGYAESVVREYFVERLERLYDVFKELTENTMTGFWTTVLDTIHLDVLSVADALGRAGTGKAPKLNELTTIGPPGIDVDASGMATITYAGGASQGTNGFPLIVANSGALGLFLNSRLEKSTSEDRSVTDLSLVAGRGAAESAGPSVTLEQIRLSPLFGSEFMHANLDNLLPGIQVDLNFEETCAFSLPLAEYRETSGTPGISYVAELTRARIDQIDVQVSVGDGGINEAFTASYRPFITDYVADVAGQVATPSVDPALQIIDWSLYVGGRNHPERRF